MNMSYSVVRRFSSLVASVRVNPSSTKPSVGRDLRGRKWNPIPIPHRSLPDPRGQDLDLINVAHSHLIHSDWDKLGALSTHLNPFRVKHILLKIQKDYVISLEFFNWVKTQRPRSLSLENHSILLHILTRHWKFKSAESIMRSILAAASIDLPARLFDAVLHSYRLCDSSPRVFDLMFKTYAHVKKFRNATNTFFQMKDYGLLPGFESCNAYISSLLDSDRVDIALGFYREMRRCRISPNVYTLNMVMSAYCKSGKLDKAVQVFEKMERQGLSPTPASYNTLIAGHCDKGLLSSALKLKNSMAKNGLHPNVVTFNTLIHGYFKDGKLQEANKVFTEMKAMNVAPNTTTYNTLITGYSETGNVEMGIRLYEEMAINGVKRDILTYNACILGLCKQGKTKNAAYLVKELDKDKLIPNASTFSAVIRGQCVRGNADRAFQLCKSMVRSGYHPNDQTLNVLISTFCSNHDFDGAVEVLREMLGGLIVPCADIVNELRNRLEQCGKSHLASGLLRERDT